jgi:hypothetical protein
MSADSPWEIEPEPPDPSELCPVCGKLGCVCPEEAAFPPIHIKRPTKEETRQWCEVFFKATTPEEAA